MGSETKVKPCEKPTGRCLTPIACGTECLHAIRSTPTPAADGEPWVIWSHEHRAYWRAERRGYCDFLIGAGVYSEEEAKAIATEVSRDPSKQNEARSLASELAPASTGTIGAYLAALDAYRAAVRAATLAEVERVLTSEAFVDDLADVVDDINPRPTHEGDRRDARLYAGFVAKRLLAALRGLGGNKDE